MIYIFLAFFGTSNTHEQYIQCNLLNAKICEIVFGIPVSVQIAQGIIESGCGKSHIGTFNNHFGMKHYSKDCSYIVTESGTKWKAFSTVFFGYWVHAKFLSEHYASGCHKSAAYWANFKGYGDSGYWKHIYKIIKQQNLERYDVHRD
jgi:flagellum-specific peptidoglycan hydrolase FlgJ